MAYWFAGKGCIFCGECVGHVGMFQGARGSGETPELRVAEAGLLPLPPQPPLGSSDSGDPSWLLLCSPPFPSSRCCRNASSLDWDLQQIVIRER